MSRLKKVMVILIFSKVIREGLKITKIYLDQILGEGAGWRQNMLLLSFGMRETKTKYEIRMPSPSSTTEILNDLQSSFEVSILKLLVI